MNPTIFPDIVELRNGDDGDVGTDLVISPDDEESKGKHGTKTGVVVRERVREFELGESIGSISIGSISMSSSVSNTSGSGEIEVVGEQRQQQQQQQQLFANESKARGDPNGGGDDGGRDYDEPYADESDEERHPGEYENGIVEEEEALVRKQRPRPNNDNNMAQREIGIID